MLQRRNSPSLLKLTGLAMAVLVAVGPVSAWAASGPSLPSAKSKHSTQPKSNNQYFARVSSQIELNPFSGPPGSPVTVSGKWFYYFQPVSLFWDTKDRPLATLQADPQGSFTTTVKPPDDYVGNHSICVADAPWIPCQIFGLLPRIPASLRLAPAEGQPGTAVQVTGANFEAGQQINLVWSANGKTLGTVLADANGAMAAQFEIPEGAAGSYQICANPVKSLTQQGVCNQVTVDPVPVAVVNQQSTGLAQFFGFMVILLALLGSLLFFLAARRRPVELPEATVEHRVGPSLMPSTHREFWESLGFSHQEERAPPGIRQPEG